MTLPNIDQKYMLDFLVGLLNTPSPTGFTDGTIEYTEKALREFPEVSCTRTRKGGLLVKWDGQRDDHPCALTAHVDTLYLFDHRA